MFQNHLLAVLAAVEREVRPRGASGPLSGLGGFGWAALVGGAPTAAGRPRGPRWRRPRSDSWPPATRRRSDGAHESNRRLKKDWIAGSCQPLPGDPGRQPELELFIGTARPQANRWGSICQHLARPAEEVTSRKGATNVGSVGVCGNPDSWSRSEVERQAGIHPGRGINLLDTRPGAIAAWDYLKAGSRQAATVASRIVRRQYYPPIDRQFACKNGRNGMGGTFDFVVVGGGSAGAVIASRLTEDASCRVALIEAGDRPPEISSMPVACASMQLNPEVDWMYSADPGKAGLGLNDRRVPVPRGKMLGGSSSINYMVYVRGHPGDFNSWATGGAKGWSYNDILPYFRKSEGLGPTGEAVIDREAHNTTGPLGVSVRAPVIQAASDFVEAAVAAGIPSGDYNGRDRGGPAGTVSLVQSTTRRGKRSSTYHAFLEGEPERRPNLSIITGAQATRVILEPDADRLIATGVEYRTCHW